MCFRCVFGRLSHVCLIEQIGYISILIIPAVYTGRVTACVLLALKYNPKCRFSLCFSLYKSIFFHFTHITTVIVYWALIAFCGDSTDAAALPSNVLFKLCVDQAPRKSTGLWRQFS